MGFEQDFGRVWAASPRVKLWRNHPAYPTMTGVLGWLYCHFMLPHCFLPFPLLTGAKIWAAYQRYYISYLGVVYPVFFGRVSSIWAGSKVF